MRGFRFLVLAIVAAVGVLALPAGASAHAMHADVTVAAEVKVVVYFDEELPGEFATVSVTDASGQEILTGKADERGVWAFPKPAPGEYTLRAKCTGHVATVSFRVEGEPESPPVAYTDWRLNKAVGIAAGLALLLGISAISWFRRWRRRG